MSKLVTGPRLNFVNLHAGARVQTSIQALGEQAEKLGSLERDVQAQEQAVAREELSLIERRNCVEDGWARSPPSICLPLRSRRSSRHLQMVVGVVRRRGFARKQAVHARAIAVDGRKGAREGAAP